MYKEKLIYGKVRCEHNCHLCKKEYLGRCVGKYYGKNVSIGRDYKTESVANVTDLPVCDEYEYGGTDEHLKEIEEAESQGKIYLKM